MTRLLVAFVLLACGASLAAGGLLPYQQRALDELLAPMDPQTRAMMRPRLEQTLSMLTEEQVEMMLAGMDESEEAVDEPEPEPAAPDQESLAHNRAQYEPALRRAWAADSAFDRFVDERLAAHCPAEGSYAVFGSAWRYEVMPLSPNWPRASQNADLDVEILGASYAPQEGRYRFDFSTMRERFDESAVAAAVEQACAAYRAIGESFMADTNSRITDAAPAAGDALVARANGEVEQLRSRLESTLAAHAPNARNSVLMSLISAEPAG